MIPLEKQVCSLDLAKRLKEFGVAQESLYFWKPVKGKHLCHHEKDPQHIHDFRWQLVMGSAVASKDGAKTYQTLREMNLLYAAFTVAELEILLPLEVNIPFPSGKKRAHNHFRRFGRYGVEADLPPNPKH